MRWFENGLNQDATHLLVVCDQFSYEDFPDYVYSGEQTQDKINYWNAQELFQVREVYDLHFYMDTQIHEYRAWHLEAPSED